MASFSDTPFLGGETDEQLLAAIREADRRAEPSGAEAIAISYDPAVRRFRLNLKAGAVLEFDRDRLPELAGATDEQLAHGLGLSPSGSALECRSLDMDISTEGLVLDLTMGLGWRMRLHKLAAREFAGAKSPAKAAAARENGKRGGRPRKNRATTAGTDQTFASAEATTPKRSL